MAIVVKDDADLLDGWQKFIFPKCKLSALRDMINQFREVAPQHP
jgi:hypothetical protein